MERNETLKHIKGTLIGCAYGDAMGMPTELVKLEDIKEIFPNGVHKFCKSTERDFHGRNMQAGEITDDTVNTILISQMIIDNQGVINAQSYLDYLHEWIRKNPDKNKVVTGPSTRSAIEAIDNGVPIERAGIMGITNGASMKISPIGMISDYHDMKTLIDNVEQICIPTHNNFVAIAGASAVAACVSYGVRGGNSIHDLWKIALKAIRMGSQRGFKHAAVSLERRILAVKDLVTTHSFDVVIDELQNFYGTGSHTVETIPAVFAIVSLANGNPLEAASISANIGGDTDTIGAISTAICGSMNPDFPKEDVELLESVNNLSFDTLAEGILPHVK